MLNKHFLKIRLVGVMLLCGDRWTDVHDIQCSHPRRLCIKHCSLSDGPIFLQRRGLATPDQSVVSSRWLFIKGHLWECCAVCMLCISSQSCWINLCFVIHVIRHRGAL
jgi:hypothetical protein